MSGVGAIDVEVRPDGPERTSRVAAATAIGAALLAVVSGLPSTGPPPATVAVVAGPVEVASDAGWRALSVGAAVEPDALIRAAGATATVTVDGGEVSLADGARVRVGRGPRAPWELVRGSVLLQGEQVPAVAIGGATARGAGVWRIDAGGRPRVAVYDGAVDVADGASEAAVPSLRQLTVRDGVVGGALPEPLRYLATDPFDVAFLDEALRVDELAASLGRSLAATYGTAPRRPSFYAAFSAVGDGDGPTLRSLAPVIDGARFGPPADVLLGAAAIDALAEVGGDRAAAAAAVADLRGAGASWGLVLLDGGAGADDLAAAADRALVRAADDPATADDPEAGPAPDADVVAPSSAAADGTAPPPAAAPGGDATDTPTPTGAAPATRGTGGSGEGGGGSDGGSSGGGRPSGGGSPPPLQPSPGTGGDAGGGPAAPVDPPPPTDGPVREVERIVDGAVTDLLDAADDVVGASGGTLGTDLGADVGPVVGDLLERG